MEESGKLTREMLDAAFSSIAKQGSQPRHDCRYDGHVAQFMARTCVYCGAVIRELTPDENHVKYGEF